MAVGGTGVQVGAPGGGGGCVAVGMDIDIFYGEKTGDEYPYRYPFGPKGMDEMRRFVKNAGRKYGVSPDQKAILSEPDWIHVMDLARAFITTLG